MTKLATIDLCCGMGGLSYAAKKSGLSVLAGVDTGTHALSSYQTNFARALPINGDITEDGTVMACMERLESRGRRSRDLIVVSGPPCQGFSDAGLRRAEDPRNQVLVSVAKAIVRLRPAGALVENVAALRKKTHSAVLRRFRAVLNAAGYHVYGVELDSLDFGVPQRRRRIIYFVLPFAVRRSIIPEKLRAFHKKAGTVKDTLGDLPEPPVRSESYDPARDNGSLANHYAMKHSERVQTKIALIEPGKGPLSYRKLKPDSYAATLISGHRAPPVHYEQPRSITVREALRLQGFPDDFRVMGAFGSQMEQVTNAVPLALGKATLSVLLAVLGEAS
jgi:DNA (cytosine-5)-methyltransferase 1